MKKRFVIKLTCSVMESDVTGWPDAKFLTGQVLVGSHTQAYNF